MPKLSLEIQEVLSDAFESHDYQETFPLVFNFEESLFFPIYSESTLASVCIGYPIILQGRQRSWLCLNIGSVATKKRFQKKGFASRAVALAKEFAQKNGYAFSFLFAQEQDFYKKNGFFTSQYQDLFSLVTPEDLSLKLPANITISILGEDEDLSPDVWNDFISFTQLQSGVLSYLDFKACLKIPNLKIVRAYEDKKCVGLFMYGKGMDYKEAIHGIAFKDESKFLMALKLFLEREKMSRVMIVWNGEEKFAPRLLPYEGIKSSPLMLSVSNIKKEEIIHLDQALAAREFTFRSLLSK